MWCMYAPAYGVVVLRGSPHGVVVLRGSPHGAPFWF